ncbi:MAG: helix-turn-helix domain-containing protein [Clostridiales Family XIII bacterium]|nr:helix-turn-helix domain-containing protein [Clostridiales Family XIII bacterium]
MSERIKSLREKAGRTQLELATELGVGRTSVSSWEMGFSAPSTAMVVELARVFSVTTDYLLGNECESTVDVSGLSANEVSIVVEVIEGMRGNRKA